MSGRVAEHRVPVATSLQRWDSLAFVHWAYPPDAVARLLPDGLVVDVLDGRAWVGLTPFVMCDVRPPGLPPLALWSRFVEVNLRTYVRHPASGTDGIWFFTLLCPRRAVVAGLRQLGLPYVHAATGSTHERGVGDPMTYRATSFRGELMDVRLEVGDVISNPDPWTVAVTGRWNAFARRGPVLSRVPVEHEPWPLREATLTGVRTNLLHACGLPAPAGPPHVCWSPGVDVRIGVPRLTVR
ncbi:DUF2071 domain-containing protein [Cellulomonas fimi]|uniref:YqjF family protein n=1 Tax=Cellulomonas fimi TaxID=1708 RepID=UPI00234CD940|nr:DUF2071 domain-containing protein [Cellulomonas fimi]MDC7121819.1 DUF2071 domain-containing protein [Cellulomonas fimi]